MADSNIDDFDKAVGLIFARLYEHFPVRISIDYKILGESSAIGPDWLGEYARQVSLFSSTMSWLVEAGYVWCGIRDERSGVFTDSVLSAKGLEILHMPTSLGPSLGSSLRTAAVETSADAIKDLAKTALSNGAAFLANYGRSLI